MYAYFFAGAHIGADINRIFPRLQHIAERFARLSGVVKRRHVGARERHNQPLLLAGQQGARLFVCGETLQRLAQFSLRSAVIDLHDLFARRLADILDLDRNNYSVVRLHNGLVGQLERGVAQTEAEREHDLFGRESLKISVTDKNILCVVIVQLLSEVFSRRIALVAVGNGIGQLAARRHLAGEHLAYGVSALHAALPDIEHGA